MTPRIVPRDKPGQAFVEVACIRKPKEEPRICRFRVSTAGSSTDQAGLIWGWDGNVTRPTITPSIACQSCGLHVVIADGVEHGRPPTAARER
jgi:hypothetical protein